MVGKKLRFAQNLCICFLPIFEDGQALLLNVADIRDIPVKRRGYGSRDPFKNKKRMPGRTMIHQCLFLSVCVLSNSREAVS